MNCKSAARGNEAAGETIVTVGELVLGVTSMGNTLNSALQKRMKRGERFGSKAHAFRKDIGTLSNHKLGCGRLSDGLLLGLGFRCRVGASGGRFCFRRFYFSRGRRRTETIHFKSAILCHSNQGRSVRRGRGIGSAGTEEETHLRRRAGLCESPFWICSTP